MGNENSEVKIIGVWASPFVMRPRIALNLKSVEYDFIEEPMYPKSELLLKSNPVHNKVPVLLHNDKPVCESIIIVEYIDESFSSGSSILPSDAYDRATERFWAAYVDDKLYPNTTGLMKAETTEAKETAIAQLKEGIELLDGALIKISNGKPFFGGDSIGLVDIAFGSYLAWLRALEKLGNIELLGEAKTPSLAAWADKFCAHDAVKDVMPEADKLVEFAKMSAAKRQAEAAAASSA